MLNRNSKPQVQGVKLIEADRHNLDGVLKDTLSQCFPHLTSGVGNGSAFYSVREHKKSVEKLYIS